MPRLDKKNSLVTGAGSGIGQAIAILFAQQGCRVCVIDRNEEAGHGTVEKIRIAGGIATFAALNVDSETDSLMLATRFPAPDILVNVAGIGHVGTLLQTTAGDLDRLYATNVRGVFNLCRAFVPGMLERGSGSVINMASVAGVVAVRDRFAYTATKFAVVGMTKALALDHSSSGVRFNAICPCRVLTPFVENRLSEYADTEAARREMESTQLAGRMARPEEIAHAALYLASDEAAMVTGSTFMIDSGWTAGK